MWCGSMAAFYNHQQFALLMKNLHPPQFLQPDRDRPTGLESGLNIAAITQGMDTPKT